MGKIATRFRENYEGFWKHYSWLVVVFVAALLCDGISTVHFMRHEGVDGEMHPAIYSISLFLGPVAGPIVGMCIKALAGIGLAIYLRKYAIYIFFAASALSFWAAWYNIWGWRVYTPIIFEWILRLRM